MKLVEFVADQLGYRKPTFKDAEEGIDVRKIQDHIKSHKKHGLTNLIDWNYIKIYKEFKKILKEEIK